MRQISIISLTIFLFLTATVLLTGCSAEKTNLVAVTYHNTTARYNAYYIAKERIREIQASIQAKLDNNYDEVLNILPPLDSMTSVTYSSQIEDALKKASIAIQNHPNSKWVDDCYTLVGMSRLYGYEYTHAIETFKYVNTTSKDDNARHRALIQLMRTFIEYEEMNNAIAVSDYLEKEDLNTENRKDLLIMRAWYYQNMEDYNNMVFNLDQVSSLINKKDNKARIYFIMGQVYQKLGFESEAFNHYKRSLASNPEYEISFYAKLNMAQVTQLARPRDVKNVRKYFRKLVKDAKNEEYKDKIYYEWGEFEMKQGLLDEAIGMYNTSIAESISNPRQKGISYLKLASIYYDTLKDYRVAKLYYDSTVQTLPKDFESYDIIKARQEVLDDFVVQLATIDVQDSLLKLAEMDSMQLVAFINDFLTQKEEEEAIKRDEEEKSNRLQNNPDVISSGLFASTGLSESTGWYFDNPSAVAIGKSEFIKIWGNRSLEDNWRRSQKTQSNVFASQTTESTESPDGSGSNTVEESSDPEQRRAQNFARLFASVPRTSESKADAHAKMEQAYYKLGNIYYFDLKEEDNAITAFETLLSNYSETSHRPEALYQLYLIYDNRGNEIEKANSLKSQLISEFPETTYSKILINPNYQQESQATNELLKKEYERAYQLFLNKDYKAATAIADAAISGFPEASFTPYMILLKILITGKTEDLHQYQIALTSFLEEHPDTDVTGYARTLLSASDNYKNSLIKLKEAQFEIGGEDIFYFIAVYNTNQEGVNDILPEIKEFNSRFFDIQNLKTSTLRLDNDNMIVIVDQFKDQEAALLYFDMFKAEQTILSEYPSLKFDNFVISKSNFTVLYQSKELDAYKQFYTRYY